MIKNIIAWLAKIAGLNVVKNTVVDTDPDGGFYDDWSWRLP